MKQSGSADLALMRGHIPPWLFQRMTQLSLSIVEAILMDQGKKGLLKRMSNPFWFQSFGAVIGMDWNSSGVTTAVMRALKTSLNPHAPQLGLYICGGKGKESLKTPQELRRIGDKTGLDAYHLIRCSKLSAKVDNTALQDGFKLYLHNFILTDQGDWTVIQQGMKTDSRSARRYHWHSGQIQSFVQEPHAAICGAHQGEIVNLVDKNASNTQEAILKITQEAPEKMMKEIVHAVLPKQYGVGPKDVDIKRLRSILWVAQESQTSNFEELLLLKGLGPRTLQSLALVSEVIHGTPCRFNDPARFSFAHGGKGGSPFPVPTNVYDETIETLKQAVDLAKIGNTDKQKALKKLSKIAQKAEDRVESTGDLEAILEKERKESYKHGGRTVKGFSQAGDAQLSLFD